MRTTTRGYGFGTRVALPYDQAIERTRTALKEQSFGVLTEIDVKKTLKEKLDADFRPYIILGACNPPLAHRALGAEPQIGLLLPCNVVVQETVDGGSIVSMLDPKALFSLVDNPAIRPVAEDVEQRLRRVLESL